MMAIAVIAGLGNPGPEYAPTRHNMGFRVVDAFASGAGAGWVREKRFEAEVARAERAGRSLILAKPSTFMNLSGKAIGALLRYFRIPPGDLAVVYDEVNLPLGRIKLSVGGGTGGHNGVADICSRAGADFVRFRVGIGPKSPPQISLTDFVLGRFQGEEEALVEGCLPTCVAGLELLVDRGPVMAMNRLNQKADRDDANGN